MSMSSLVTPHATTPWCVEGVTCAGGWRPCGAVLCHFFGGYERESSSRSPVSCVLRRGRQRQLHDAADVEHTRVMVAREGMGVVGCTHDCHDVVLDWFVYACCQRRFTELTKVDLAEEAAAAAAATTSAAAAASTAPAPAAGGSTRGRGRARGGSSSAAAASAVDTGACAKRQRSNSVSVPTRNQGDGAARAMLSESLMPLMMWLANPFLDFGDGLRGPIIMPDPNTPLNNGMAMSFIIRQPPVRLDSDDDDDYDDGEDGGDDDGQEGIVHLRFMFH